MTDGGEARCKVTLYPNRHRYRWIGILGIVVLGTLVVDNILGTVPTAPEDAIHEGPFGMAVIWTPGITLLYIAFALFLLPYLRGGAP